MFAMRQVIGILVPRPFWLFGNSFATGGFWQFWLDCPLSARLQRWFITVLPIIVSLGLPIARLPKRRWQSIDKLEDLQEPAMLPRNLPAELI